MIHNLDVLQILEAVGPTVLLGSDFQKLRSEGYLSPFHPRYPEKLTNSAHPAVRFETGNDHVLCFLSHFSSVSQAFYKNVLLFKC